MPQPLPPATGTPLVEFIALMERMRQECAWKASQTHSSLARFLLEETHETLEAIEAGDPDHLREELGDLLLQVYFHAEIATRSGEFTIDDVAATLTEKMIRRNPHVFGEVQVSGDPADINEMWQAIKADEKQRTSVFDGIAPTLPALLLADKVLDRLERAGLPALEPAPDPSPELSLESGSAPGSASPREPDAGKAIGDRLLALVAEARTAGVDPEQALRAAVRRLAAGT